MLSYRHSFHAGNHADVLKHIVLVELLRYLADKPKPLWYVDTHAGAGLYELGTSAAGSNEADSGIRRVFATGQQPSLVRQYLAAIERCNPAGTLRWYPGSPRLAADFLRPDDRLWLCELHPADHAALERVFDRDKSRVRIRKQDGLAGLRALLPPAPKRGLILVDPSYEVAADYRAVPAALRDAGRRFATGVYAVWYPLLASRASRSLPAALRGAAGANWLDARVQVRGPGGGGLYGSGMFVINPPYTLAGQLAETLPWLASSLALSPDAGHGLEVAPG